MFGILLTLPIIDFKFALAAPVLVQEKRHACVDAVHSPKDVVTVLEKRVEEDDTWKLLEDLFGHKLPDADAPLSPAPPLPDHGSKVDVPAPKPNLASSTNSPTANLNPLMGSLADAHAASSSAPLGPDLVPKPNLASSTKTSTANPDPLMSSPAPLSWPSYLLEFDVQPPTVNPASEIELGRHFSDRMATLDGLPAAPKPPRKSRKRPRPRPRPRPKNPGPPTVPEQEVGTAPLPNPSSPIEHSD
jgi:hypothetical protein